MLVRKHCWKDKDVDIEALVPGSGVAERGHRPTTRTSDPDPHVPVQRVHDTVKILSGMNALVTEKIYERMGHTINQDEFDHANELLKL